MSMAAHIPVLETERLRLRAWREEDLDPFAAFVADEAATRFVGGTGNRQNAWRRMAMFLGHWTLRGHGPWVIEEKTSSRWVGYCGLWSPEGWPEPELMWSLAAGAHGKGYATEAAQRGREFAYRKLGWTTLTSFIDPHNEPSLRVAQRLSAAHERDVVLADNPVGLYRHPGPQKLHS
jgi:RimJ/RimL family protein N-acetyltransferase